MSVGKVLKGAVTIEGIPEGKKAVNVVIVMRETEIVKEGIVQTVKKEIVTVAESVIGKITKIRGRRGLRVGISVIEMIVVSKTTKVRTGSEILHVRIVIIETKIIIEGEMTNILVVVRNVEFSN